MGERKGVVNAGGEGETTKREGGKGVCKVEGCGKERKYRVVGGGEREWKEGWGGCGLDHLRVVQGMGKGR